MWIGVLAALGAGLLWGSVFVAPLLLPHYPSLLLTFGRYFAFGVVALPIAWWLRVALRQLSPADWRAATRLSLVGNFIYYLTLSAAVQLCGAPLPSLLIGTLPIVIAISAHWSSDDIPWRKLAAPLLLVVTGLLLINVPTLHALVQTQNTHSSSLAAYAWGVICACMAVAAWTWYPLKNSAWLKQNPQVSATTWATAQGLVTLPMAVIGWLLSAFFFKWLADTPLEASFMGDAPKLFWGLMLLMGLGASWLGTLLWNVASQRTAPALMGQLLVFEALSALLYAYITYQRWPNGFEAAGIACLVLGVSVGVKRFR